MSSRIYLPQTVLEAARERIDWLFQEFPRIYVNVSGGKDSTVVLRLALEAAERHHRLPLDAFFADQEAEWQTAVDHLRTELADPRIRAHWLQIPLRSRNAGPFVAWDPEAEAAWMRPKEPDSEHLNRYGTDEWDRIFEAWTRHHHPRESAARISGIRAEENPGRRLGLTTYATYKGRTWAGADDRRRQHFTFYPLYDWTLGDVWKAIHDHGWPYCPLYDLMWARGIPLQDMRISNVHGGKAVRELYRMAELEPETWNRLTARLEGINGAAQLQAQFMCPRTLPWMFRDWRDYRDYLLEHLVADPADRQRLAQLFTAADSHYTGQAAQELLKCEIASVLVNDREGTKLKTFMASHCSVATNRGKIGGNRQPA